MRDKDLLVAVTVCVIVMLMLLLAAGLAVAAQLGLAWLIVFALSQFGVALEFWSTWAVVATATWVLGFIGLVLGRGP